MVPFLVDTDRLFELFVFEWMKAHVPSQRLVVHGQESAAVGEAAWLRFRVDLVLRERETGPVWCVLDTKYKGSGEVDQAYISQVVTYAKLKGATQAVPIYPTPLAYSLDHVFGDVRDRACTFSLAGDLEQAGQAFLKSVLSDIDRGAVRTLQWSLSGRKGA